MGMKREKIKNWTYVFLWMITIFYLSSIPSFKISKVLKKEILSYIAHFFEFFILNFFLYRALLTNQNKKKFKIFITSSIFSVFYAFTDEVHQSFVIGRECSEIDFLIDTFGILSLFILIEKF